MEDLFHGMTLINYHSDPYRNIVSLRISEQLFDDLSDSPAAWKAGNDLEIMSKPHTHQSNEPIIDRPFEEAEYNEAIGYPFNNWSMSRYSNGSFGVWYAAETLESTVWETEYHWRNSFLADSGWANLEGVEIERKVYTVQCDAALLDFRVILNIHPRLIDRKNYDLTHQVGSRIHHDGHPGLISRSARCKGDVLAIFNKQVLSNPKTSCYLTYRIENGVTVIKREAGEVMMSI
jgi:hypothetical protein